MKKQLSKKADFIIMVTLLITFIHVIALSIIVIRIFTSSNIAALVISALAFIGNAICFMLDLKYKKDNQSN